MTKWKRVKTRSLHGYLKVNEARLQPGSTMENEMLNLGTKKQYQSGTGIASDPQVAWVDVTPEVAAEWLKMNTLNRPKKLQKIALYTADMKGHRWPVTGAALCFSKSGRLLDGQNRLQAIVDSGVTIRMLVVTGLDDDIFDVIDGGARRTASDVLVIEGYAGWIASCGATAARISINLSNGRLPYGGAYSPQIIRRYVNDHPELMSSVEFIETLPRRPAPIPHSAAAALHFHMAENDSDMADLLMTQLYRGDNMSADDMVLRLRNNLLGRVQQKDMTTSNDYTLALSAIVRVWNARRAGRDIRYIGNAFTRGGEAFPDIK